VQIQRQEASEEIIMPIYEFLCDSGHKFDRFLKLKDYDQPQTCECGRPADKQLSAPMVHVDFPAYVSPASGKYITSRAERRADMKATGCVDYEPSLKAEQEKRYAAEDAALDKKVEEHVEREIINMPVEKREKLAAEVEHLDITVTRA
jgi:putative FmdB family regulatory protein